ncbi:MAG: hypothetical protein IT386_16400 [Deltaproteobacteria bacterium]|nr:hypothetical protein [Deltaproteobacteria bacterium]
MIERLDGDDGESGRDDDCAERHAHAELPHRGDEQDREDEAKAVGAQCVAEANDGRIRAHEQQRE